MSRMSDFLAGDYLTAEDVPPVGAPPLFALIDCSEWRDVSKQDEPEEWKLILHFQDVDKALVCNKTNLKKLLELFGDDGDNPTAWRGSWVSLYWVETQMGNGVRIGPAVTEQMLQPQQPPQMVAQQQPPSATEQMLQQRPPMPEQQMLQQPPPQQPPQQRLPTQRPGPQQQPPPIQPDDSPF